MKTSRLHQGRSAWTVLELVIAAALIVVLLLISLAASRSYARQSEAVRCVTNLKQAGAAFLIYTRDYNQNVIRSQMGGSNAEYGWTRLMVNMGYLPGDQPWKTLICPSSRIPQGAKTSMTRYNPRSPNLAAGDMWRWYTYGLNTCKVADKTGNPKTLTLPNGAVVRIFELPMARIEKASSHVLLADSYDKKTGYATEHLENDNAKGLGMWHGSRANPYGNAFFADGHVEGVNVERARQLGEGLNLLPQYIFDPQE